MQKFKLSINTIIIGVLIILLIIGLVFSITFMNKQINVGKDLMTESNYIVQQYEEFISAQIAESNRLDSSERERESYILYFDRLIINFYADNPSNRLNEMNAEQRRLLLGSIYDYAKSPSANYGFIDEYLPLAFIFVETQFYPYRTRNGNKELIRGGDGERSMFQFMEGTAKDVYRRMGKEWNSEWYTSIEDSVWVWFNGYKEIFVRPFEDASSDEFRIRWSAYHYNRGGYRNQLIPYYKAGRTIEQHLIDYPINKGNKEYNNQIYFYYLQFKNGFEQS